MNTNTTVEIILSTSLFTSQPIYGLALAGASNPLSFEKWADAHGRGRPATSQTLNGRPAAQQIQYLVSRWTEWSERTGIPLQINPTPRKVAAPF